MTIDPLPALVGGKPIRPQGPPSWPPADPEVGLALDQVFSDGSWGRYLGGHVERLEGRLKELHGVEFALTCGSGTFAVELALRALKVGPGDEVILAAYDYPGNFLAAHALGAIPLLIDVHPSNWNLSPDRLADALGPKVRAVIVSHLHGGIVPMREVMACCAARNISVVEDAAQAAGAIIQGRPAGSWGDVGVLSFGGSKLLTAGRGGAILTRHAEVHQRARVWLQRGNHLCPLSELQAAVLIPQLEPLEKRSRIRASGVQWLAEQLRDVPGIRLFDNQEIEGRPAYYKVGFQFDAERFGLPRDQFLAAVRAEGIAMDEGFRSLHVGRAPRRFRAVGRLDEAERAHHGVVVLHHPILLGTRADVAEVADAIAKIRAFSASNPSWSRPAGIVP